MGGLWHTVSGTLDAIVHLWAYQDIAERTRIRQEMMQPGKWPPPLRPHLVEMHSTVLLPASFSPMLGRARHGAVYEFCIDTFLPGGPAACEGAWPAGLAARTALAPLVFCGATEFGQLNQWVHIWAYRDAAHWAQVQQQSASIGWPPAEPSSLLLRRESFLAAPAECSDLR